MQTTKVGEPRGGFVRREFEAARVRPRKTFFSFPADTSRYWVGGSPTRTHVLNSLHLFLPSFERMILRTVLDEVVPRLDDPQLIAQARGLAGQESSHSRAHELFIETLRAQGYPLDRYLKITEWILEDLLEKKLGYKLSLSVVAAFEHYTDILVLLILRSDFVDGCDPRVLELMEWHSAEEVEHNAVAHQLLRTIDDRESLRMVGNVLGLAVILGFMLAGTGYLLQHDGKLLERQTARELGQFFFTKYGVAGEIVKMFRHYARRDYRPDDVDYSELARAVLAG